MYVSVSVSVSVGVSVYAQHGFTSGTQSSFTTTEGVFQIDGFLPIKSSSCGDGFCTWVQIIPTFADMNSPIKSLEITDLLTQFRVHLVHVAEIAAAESFEWIS